MIVELVMFVVPPLRVKTAPPPLALFPSKVQPVMFEVPTFEVRIAPPSLESPFVILLLTILSRPP